MSSVVDASSPKAQAGASDSNSAAGTASVIFEVQRARMYSSSALHAARHFSCTLDTARILDLADELQHREDLPAVAVVNADGAALGIIERDKLFGLLGKSFGREVLARSHSLELIEKVPIFDAHADLFAVAEVMLSGESEYCLLVGSGSRFLGLLASQDLANYLSRITQEDIELAGRLQERLLAMAEGFHRSSELQGPLQMEEADAQPVSESSAQVRPYTVEAWSRPAKGVGGDFYFTKALPDGSVFLALCDVSGKGVAASLIVSMVWGMLSMYDYGRGLAELVTRLNESIVTTFHMEKYLTGIFLIYEPSTNKLRYADMGHSHALLFRGGKPRSLKGPKGNLPIGIEPDIEPAIYPYKLQSGDRLFIYTDGLTEQENAAGAEFGERRLVETTLVAIAHDKQLREALPAALDEHRSSGRENLALSSSSSAASLDSETSAALSSVTITPQQDDMSFLLLSIH